MKEVIHHHFCENCFYPKWFPVVIVSVPLVLGSYACDLSLSSVYLQIAIIFRCNSLDTIFWFHHAWLVFRRMLFPGTWVRDHKSRVFKISNWQHLTTSYFTCRVSILDYLKREAHRPIAPWETRSAGSIFCPAKT